MSIQNLIKESGSNALLTRAVELDNEGRYPEALAAYQAGLEQLLPLYKEMKDLNGKAQLKSKISTYMDRAELLRKTIDKQKEEGKYHEEFRIENDSCGHSYGTIFTRYIDPTLTEVFVEDPYIRSTHQIFNFVRFCEMIVASTGNVKKIHLITGQDDKNGSVENQVQSLRQLHNSLSQHGIELLVEYSSTLHDRQITFNNGWIIKIGRGLDYFKATENKCCIGFCDMSLRKCYETTVNVFHSKHTKPLHHT